MGKDIIMKVENINEFLQKEGCLTCMILRRLILNQESVALHTLKEFYEIKSMMLGTDLGSR